MELAYNTISPHPDADHTLSPIILLHGFTSSRLSWTSVASTIANTTRRKVYALDARNHGESGWTAEFTYHAMANDLECFMQSKGISRTILIGHSMGGKTAMFFAISQPEKVEKLIVEDISTKPGTADQTFLPKYFKALRHSLTLVDRNMDLNTARKIISQYFFSNFPNAYESERLKDNIASTLPIRKLDDGNFAWQANIDFLDDAGLKRRCLRVEVEGVYEGDTLFIYGTKSPFAVYEDKDDILKNFPKSLFVPVNGAGHMIHQGFPEEYLRSIFDFI